MRSLVLLPALALGGCHVTTHVAPGALRDAGMMLGGPKVVGGPVGRAQLEPGTMVRARLADGSSTGWLEASSLHASAEGLMVGEPRPAQAPEAGTRAPGFRWDEVSGLELRSLDPALSLAAVPLFPLSLPLLLLDTDGLTSPTEGEGSGGRAPPRAWFEPAQPLFTGRARRRAIVQPLATIDALGTHGGDLSAGVGVGARFRNFYEVSAVARGFSLQGEGTRASLYTFGIAMGLHVDGDGESAFGFHLGAEVTSRPGDDTLTAFQLKWGPRLGLGGGLFLTASPLSLSTLTLPDADGRVQTVARFAFSLELGGTL